MDQPNLPIQHADRQLAVVEWMTSRPPHRVDRALEARLSALSDQKLVIHGTTMFPETGPSWTRFDTVSVHGVLSEQDIEALRGAVEAAMVPMPRSMIAEHLTRLHALTAGSARGDRDHMARVAVLTDELEPWPADAVYAALRRPWKWFPSWGDLHAELERHTAWRRALRASLDRLRPGASSADDNAPTIDERRAMGEKLSALARQIAGSQKPVERRGGVSGSQVAPGGEMATQRQPEGRSEALDTTEGD